MSRPDDTTKVAFLFEKDPAKREELRLAAYRELFGSMLGRGVLSDILREAGVGQLQGPPSGVEGARDYRAGMNDLAITIMQASGFVQADAIALTLDGEEGYFDERRDYSE